VTNEYQALHTIDGGSNWTIQSLPVTETLENVRFKGTLDGLAVGNNGTIIRTTDGGASWTPVSSGTSGLLMGLSVVVPEPGLTSVVVVAALAFCGRRRR